MERDDVTMTIRECVGTFEKVTDTPFGYTLSLINGKWKMIILYLLSGGQPVRFNELHKRVGKVTFKVLSDQLKELENDDLIIRKEYPQVPPKVEYSLSERGKSLLPILDAMCDWGAHQQQENSKYRSH